jgi:hypothetical protein
MRNILYELNNQKKGGRSLVLQLSKSILKSYPGLKGVVFNAHFQFADELILLDLT